MSMSTPAGWYPDPGMPGTERWWDGSAWSGHTRAAGGGGYAGPGGPTAVVVPPASRGPRRGVLLGGAAAVVAVAVAVIVAVVVSGKDEEPPAPPVAGPSVSATATATGGTEPGPSSAPTEVADQLNGISLPILPGWEKPESTSDDVPTVTTAGEYQCPGDVGESCTYGTVSSRTPSSTDATTPEALAKADIAKAVQQAYGEDILGNDPYGGVRSHKLLAAKPTVVAGRAGYLVRWQVTTGAGPGGVVQSLAFTSPTGSQSPVVVRFVFDGGPNGPKLSVMDEIAAGIKPLA
ncbi:MULTISPECIES: DUF2510 domain-containing protein [Streptomyces]|uniref:DUF2510 domain-containing protein n=1 Tax=Streptomyces solicathayae TaxID=3081768 RepID=A0ABZ0M2W9_9ACTN|nr:DUF2510 domain-containing protein [Streptomyces sp. HUAS YS2]WOX25393.1 DUF2510 domain-containing protein [Streptomyces sp. HUAS YS2]